MNIGVHEWTVVLNRGERKCTFTFIFIVEGKGGIKKLFGSKKKPLEMHIETLQTPG